MSIKKTKNADIQYGKKDQLKDSDFEPRNIGHRISIVVPEDVLTDAAVVVQVPPADAPISTEESEATSKKRGGHLRLVD